MWQARPDDDDRQPGGYRDVGALGIRDHGDGTLVCRGLRELRTVQAALVEFYVASVMPGPLPAALPIEFAPLPTALEGTEAGRVLTERRDAVTDRIEDVWGWMVDARETWLILTDEISDLFLRLLR